MGRCIFLFSLLLFQVKASASAKIADITTLPDYAPYTSLTSNSNGSRLTETIMPGEDSKKLSGYSWDIVRESLHAAGWGIRLTVLPWPRALKFFESGKTQALWPTGKNEERLKKYSYSERKINSSNFIVYTKKGSEFPWDGLKSLKGRKILVKRGFNYGTEWNRHKKDINTKDVLTILQGFLMVNRGRADGFAGYDVNWDYVLANNSKGLKESEFIKLPPFGKAEEFLVTMTNLPQNREILKAFDTGKAIIIANGRFAEIQKKWSPFISSINK